VALLFKQHRQVGTNMHMISQADLTVGTEIRRHRRKAGLTQKDVAARIGVTAPQFHRYEAGTTRIATHRLIAIAEVLNIRPDRLLAAASIEETAPLIASESSTQQIVDLVQTFSSIVDPRQRGALMAMARLMASASQQRA
jgi:transcriptional regulator with XRE-family HTH domain